MKTYAKDALNSTDPETVKDAYKSIDGMIESAEGEEKIELQKLAVNLAFKASGVTDTVTDLADDLAELATMDPANPEVSDEKVAEIKVAVLKSAEENMDPEYAREYVEKINSLPPEEVTSEQYAFGAVGLVLSDPAIIEELKKPEPMLDLENPVIKQANELLEKSKNAAPDTSGSTSNSDLASLLLQYGDLLPGTP